jgi:hypothetical protein
MIMSIQRFIQKTLSCLLVAMLVLASVFSDAFFIVPHADAALNPTQRDYALTIGPSIGSTAANYVYSTFFNPIGSGTYFLIKRLKVNSIALGAATFQDLDVRRITNTSGGTQVLAANIPKKNTASLDSVADVRSNLGTTGVTFVGSTDSRIISTVAAAAAGVSYGKMEKNFDDSEKLILAPGEGIALYQTAAGSANQDISLTVEWTESVVAPTSQNEYSLTYTRVANAAGVNYVYDSFFNPGSSGNAVVVKSIRADVVGIGTATYSNNVYLQKISAASAGTQIATTNIPKKNSLSANSTSEARYLGVTATLLSTSTNSSYIRIIPPGLANQAASREVVFGVNDEKIILKPNEGLALVSSAAGSANQVVKFTIEWQEVPQGSASGAQGGYFYTFPRVSFTPTAGQAYNSFFNPLGSGKHVTIKRIYASATTWAGAAYNQISVRRTTAASGGNVIPVTNITKKHVDTGNSSMQFSTNAPTITWAGTAAMRIAAMTGPGAPGQRNGELEVYFGDNEQLVLAPGEGIALYSEVTGSANQMVLFSLEWTESVSLPVAQGEYVASIGNVSGSTVSGYNYASFFNPIGSGKTSIIKRVGFSVDAVNTARYVPITLQRITAVSGGTLIATTNLTKKNNTSSISLMTVRSTGVTATLAGNTDSRIMSAITPGTISSVTNDQRSGKMEYIFSTDEQLVLAPGEGVTLRQEAAGDADFRVRLNIEWAETAIVPSPKGELIASFGSMTGSLTSGYVYSSFLNPVASGKVYLVNRIGLHATRVGAATSPVFQQVVIRRITSASGGTLVVPANIPKKISTTAASGADLRRGSTVTYSGVTGSRIFSLSAPATVGGTSSGHHSLVPSGDQIILKPGEGVALYQESAAGDTNVRFFMTVGWSEMAISQSAYRFFSNTDNLAASTPLALANTLAIAPSINAPFRLRMVLDVNGSSLVQNQDSFKLQFSSRVGSCDASFVGEAYTDVTNASVIAWNDNASLVTGAQVAPTSTDPQSGTKTRVYETYQEANSFTNASSTSIYDGQSGVWDFSLVDNGAPRNTSYCFRVVRNDGSTLESYSIVPEIITAPAANTLPVASGISIDSGAASINLIEGTTKAVTCSGTVTDNNGFADIQSVTGDLYRTSLGTSSPLDINNHYRVSGNTQCVPSAGSGSSETYSCLFPVWFHAEPTDVGSPNSADTWSCSMTPVDSVATGTPASGSIEMASLYAIDVTPSISYGTLSPSTNTGSLNATTTVTNTGNTTTNLALSGANMTSGGGAIAVGSQKYASSNFVYTSGGVALTTVPTNLPLGLAKKVIATTTSPIYWGIGVPNGTRTGAYSGSITFTAGP